MLLTDARFLHLLHVFLAVFGNLLILLWSFWPSHVVRIFFVFSCTCRGPAWLGFLFILFFFFLLLFHLYFFLFPCFPLFLLFASPWVSLNLPIQTCHSIDRDGARFWKKNSNLCCDTADFNSSPPYLSQDCMQSHVIDMCSFKVLHWLPKKNPKMLKNPQNPHLWIEMKNLDLTNKKSGLWSNRLQKEITHPKRRLFVVFFF